MNKSLSRINIYRSLRKRILARYGTKAEVCDAISNWYIYFPKQGLIPEKLLWRGENLLDAVK